jgi:hypothetical protein
MSSRIDELLSKSIPAKLWHYTSIKGFQDIVTSKSIWATDVRFLNDREEFVHSRKVADEVVAASPEFDLEGFPFREFLEKGVKLAFESKPLASSQIYVASFSASPDQLGQWRGYSHGSTGVSLAFDLRSMRPPAELGSLVSFAPCVYNLPDRRVLVLEALKHFMEEVTGSRKKAFEAACQLNPEMRKSDDKQKVVNKYFEDHPEQRPLIDEFKTASIKTFIDFTKIVALLKDSSFIEEDEWRLVLPMLVEQVGAAKNPPRFRVGKTTLIPYIAQPFIPSAAGLPLVDVVLGPGSDENSVSAAERFLTSHGLNLKPRLSKVPYRAT